MWGIGPSWCLARRAVSSCGKAKRALILVSEGASSPHGARLHGALPPNRTTCTRAASTAASTSDAGSGKSRAYPTEPRVGVGVVVFRTQPVLGKDPEILLVRRAKEPDKGRWCFPGGSLELGETLTACAAREVVEEAGLRLQGGAYDDTLGAGGATAADGGSGGGAGASIGAWSPLAGPMPFAAVDVMARDADGRIRFHYAVIEVAAVSADPDAPLAPGDDADGAQWVPVSKLRGFPDLTSRCDEMAEEAVRRFAVAASP